MKKTYEKVGDVFARDGKLWKVTKITKQGKHTIADCIPVET